MQEIVIPSHEAPKKLENFLKKEFPIGYVRKLFRKHGVRVNGQRASSGDLVQGGDRIQIYMDYAKQTDSINRSGVPRRSLEIIYEDASLLVLNKPPGLAVHEGKTVRKSDSLLGILEKTYHGQDISPQLVHRLDKDTSGLLLVAKNPETAEKLANRFERGEIHKQYVCLLVGRPPLNEGKIDLPLPSRDGNLVHASTQYRVVKRFAETTLVRAVIETGRLHQIRLHFAKIGYPLVMDQQHGDFGFNKRFRKHFGLKRQFLHAEKLSFPDAGKLNEWTAPLPKDLDETLKKLSNEEI